MIRGTGSAGRFDIYEYVNVLLFAYMKELVCNGDDFILNSLFNFEPMKGLEHWELLECLGVRVTVRASPFLIC